MDKWVTFGLALVACLGAFWLGHNRGQLRPGVWYCVDAECCVEAKVSDDGGMAFHQDASNCGVRP